MGSPNADIPRECFEETILVLTIDIKPPSSAKYPPAYLLLQWLPCTRVFDHAMKSYNSSTSLHADIPKTNDDLFDQKLFL